MTNEKSIIYQEIGEVLYCRNPRARNIAIRINGEGHVRVTVPGRCSVQRAEKFVIEKSGWIIGKREKIRNHFPGNPGWGPGSIVEMYSGRIFIEQGAGNNYEVSNSGGSYGIMVPSGFNPKQRGDAKLLFDCIARTGAREAKVLLPEMLRRYSESCHLSFAKVTVRRMKTRWGSCSSKNNISLNSSLIFLDEQLIRYVCLHELMHTIHKNHSHQFWDALKEILPDALELRKRLRQQPIIA
jgi:predicted metal-dependent hydrolase